MSIEMYELKPKSVAYRKGQASYNRAFRDYFANKVTELPEGRFWELQAVFRGEVCTFRLAYGRTNGVEQAASEFFRKPLADDFGKAPRYTLDEAVRFAKSWQGWRGRLYQPLFDVVQARGDDAYGDLLDALPLAGREVIEKALASEFGNQGQLEAAVLIGCDGSKKLADLILHGENYVGTSLADASREFIASKLAE